MDDWSVYRNVGTTPVFLYRNLWRCKKGGGKPKYVKRGNFYSLILMGADCLALYRGLTVLQTYLNGLKLITREGTLFIQPKISYIHYVNNGEGIKIFPNYSLRFSGSCV